jgi:hypothetical protein
VRRITELILIVCSLCGVGMCQYAAVFSSYYGDKRYDFPITPESLAKSSRGWNNRIHRFRPEARWLLQFGV